MRAVTGDGRAIWRSLAFALLAAGLLPALFHGNRAPRRPHATRAELFARRGAGIGPWRAQQELCAAAPLACLFEESLDRALDTKALPEEDDDAVLAAADQLDRDAVQDMLDEGTSCLARLAEETGDLQHLPLQLPPPPPTSEPTVDAGLAGPEALCAPNTLPGKTGSDRPHSRPPYGSGYASPRAPPATASPRATVAA